MPAHASTGRYNTLVYRITGLPETKAGTKNVTGQQIITRLSLSCLVKIQNPLHVFSLFQNFNPRSRLGPLLQ